MKFIALFIILFPASLFGQGYKIDMTIRGLKDTTTFLCYYYSDNSYITDTARVDKEGKLSFSGSKALPQGVYFLALEKTVKERSRLFDIMLSDDQHFSLQTSTDEYVLNMKVTGDIDNQQYFDFLIFKAGLQKETDPLLKIIQDSTLTGDRKMDARAAYEKVSEKVVRYQEEMVSKYPTTLAARLLKSTRPVEIPQPPKKADGSIDSTFRFRYYREHYFDNFNLADDALIRLPRPVYSEKLNEYLDKLFLQTPDSIMAAVNALVPRVKKNQETYKYLVWTCLYKYQKPAIMGMDEVYVRLFDTYFASGEMDFWVNAQLKKSLKEHVDKLRTSLIGKTGANLSMQDANFQPRNLYDIHKKYTLIYFFDPDCGHCREESPKLVDFYNKNKAKLDLEVYAVCADTSIAKMKDYVKEMKMTWITVNGPRSYVGQYSKLYYAEQTPTIYILDDKKKIIAKGLSVGNLGDFFTNYEKFAVKKANPRAKGT